MTDDGDLLGHELSAAVIRFHEVVAARLDLNITEHKALDQILYAGPTTPSDLATRLGVSRAAVTKIVARLTALGHVVGVANARDGRSVYLVPTDAVRATVTDLYAPLARSMIAVLGELDDHQRRGVRLWLLGSIDALRSAAGSLET